MASQGFRTGSSEFGYRLQGIGVDVEGSDLEQPSPKYPPVRRFVSVAVHADSSGKPGAKLFDLVSADEYRPGHSFFEAPPDTRLLPNTSYVMVWRYRGGFTWHRLQRTAFDSEDLGGLTGFTLADAFYSGLDLGRLVRAHKWPCVADRGVRRGQRGAPLRALR